MNGKRILLVDEDAGLLRFLAARCREIGLVVDTARDAHVAVKLLEKKKPDLVCLDGQVPAGDGLRLSEMVLQSPDDVPCPVIILTSRSHKLATGHGAEMCVYFLQKRPDMWRYLEPVIYELVDVQPGGRSRDDRGRDVTSYAS